MLASGNKSLTIGPYTFSATELASIIVLHGYVGTDGNVSTLRVASGSAGYQVPVSFQLRIKVIAAVAGTARVHPLYGNTDVGYNSGSLPTSPVYLGGYNSATGGAMVSARDGSVNTAYNFLDFVIPAGKYPAMQINGTAPTGAIFYGILEAA